jgi:hypothetical protein
MAAVLKAVDPRHLFTITYTEQTYLALCMAIAVMPFVHKITGAVEYESLATAAGPIWRQLEQ